MTLSAHILQLRQLVLEHPDLAQATILVPVVLEDGREIARPPDPVVGRLDTTLVVYL